MLSLEERRSNLRECYPVWKKRTIFQVFLDASFRWPDRPLYQADDQCVTFAQTREKSRSVQQALENAGIQKGDRIAVNLGNCAEYLYITFAAAAIGAVKVPVNRKSTADQKLFVLNQTGSVMFLTDKEEDLSLLSRCDTLRQIIWLGGGRQEQENVIRLEDFLKGEVSGEKHCSGEPDDLSDIIFTSGSTGNPKGVMLTHDMMLRSAFANCLNRGFEDGRKIMVTVPLFHVFGYIEGLLSVLFVGGCILCSRGRFDAKKILRLIREKEANDILCVPSAMQKILAEKELIGRLPESFHAVYCSASICPEWIWDAIRSRLGVTEIVNGYGMSEVSGASVQTPAGVPNPHLKNSVGKVLTDHFSEAEKLVAYKVIDPDTEQELPPGCSGELVCRGAIVTKGYFGAEKATNSSYTRDGWFRSGDSGRIDPDGFVCFEGRRNDVYKINGENVSPYALDQIISGCREVVMAETVGIPDEKLGWVGVAFIEPVNWLEETKERIRCYCISHLASFEVPRYYLFLKGDEWPRTPNGKVTKKLLRERAARELHDIKSENV